MSDVQDVAPVKDTAATAEGTGQASSGLTASTSTTAQTALSPSAEGSSAKPPAWVAQLEADLQKDEKLTQYKSISELAKAYKEAEGKLGKSIVIPGEKASAEEMAAFRKAIGTPEKPEDYKLEKVELPNSTEPDGQWEKGLRAVAHKLNVSQAQLGGLHDWYFKNLVEEMQVIKTNAEQATNILRKRWGKDYDANTTYKTRLVNKMKPELVEKFNRTGLANDPDFIDWVVDQSKAMGEHFFAEGTRGERSDNTPIGQRSDAQLAEVLYPSKE